jgi:tellurite methyltransferase
MSDDDRRRWEARHAEAGPPAPPSPFLEDLGDLLPRSGQALDIAGGTGRHALWLLRRGLHVTLIDVSPTALARAGAAAAALSPLAATLVTWTLDLDHDSLPEGPFDLVLCTYFLNRRVLAGVARVLAPGGVLVVVHPTRSNLQRHPHPSARFLLEDGELPGLVPGLTVVHHQEGWFNGGDGDPVHEARLVARR